MVTALRLVGGILRGSQVDLPRAGEEGVAVRFEFSACMADVTEVALAAVDFLRGWR